MNFSDGVQVIHHMNPVPAGTSNQDGSAGIDMAGFDGVMFIADIGALTATQVTKLQAQGSSDNSSFNPFATDVVTATMLDGDSNKCLVVDIFQPVTRYVRARVQRGTANAVINSVIAILYRKNKKPVVQGSTVSQIAAYVSP
jgi:hypothetical protein